MYILHRLTCAPVLDTVGDDFLTDKTRMYILRRALKCLDGFSKISRLNRMDEFHRDDSGLTNRNNMTETLEERMRRAGIRDADLEETFARSGGPGGQNVNKVSTTVTLRHGPSGTSVTVQDSRSQAVNRKLARERLLAAIVGAQKERQAKKKSAREKVRRQNSPRPRGLKRRILETKRKRSALKKMRGNVGD